MRAIRHRPLLVVLAGILVAQAFLLTRLRHVAPFYDEGVYLLSVDLLRRGRRDAVRPFATAT